MDELDYLVIDSGYTALLITSLALNKAEIIKPDTADGLYRNSVIRLSHSFETVNERFRELGSRNVLNGVSDEDLNEFINSCVFICDGLWGIGTYIVGDNDVQTDQVIEILKEFDKSVFGIICFKCKTVSDVQKRIDILNRISLSRLFRCSGIHDINKDEVRIRLVQFN